MRLPCLLCSGCIIKHTWLPSSRDLLSRVRLRNKLDEPKVFQMGHLSWGLGDYSKFQQQMPKPRTDPTFRDMYQNLKPSRKTFLRIDPPLLAGEVATVAWAREMSTGAMAEMGEGAC